MAKFKLLGLEYIRATRAIARILFGAGMEDSESDARLIAEHVLGMPYSGMITCTSTVTEVQQEEAYKIIDRRINGEPLQYIIGKAWFLGREFIVEPGVLIPRRDSEVLADNAIRRAPQDAALLDMCCGSGCLGISVAAQRDDIQITLADIGSIPCEVSRANAATHGVTAEVVQSDLFENLGGRKFDMILCNPPYIPTADIAGLDIEVAAHEPPLALDGGADGLDYYRRLVPQASGYLYNGGILALEFGEGQHIAIGEMLDKHGYYRPDILFDMEGRARVAWAAWKV